MYTFKCNVLRVIDGDTLDLEIDLGFNIKIKERIRLYGLDTPETFGKNASLEGALATKFVNEWIESKRSSGQFYFYSKKYDFKDKYGRSLGSLYWIPTDINEDTFILNEDLINSGHAKPR